MELIHLPFFDEIECSEIINYIEKKESDSKQNYKEKNDNYYTKDKNSIYSNFTTRSHNSYNFFEDNPKYLPRFKKLLSKQFPNLNYPLIVQSWGNVYRKNQGISWHRHSFAADVQLQGLTSNIFIGGDENIGITYAFLDNKIPKFNYVNIKNKLGHVQFVKNTVDHMVSPNKSDRDRYSIGITITEFDIRYSKQFINIFGKNSLVGLIVIPEPYGIEKEKNISYC